jgi:hypothetical protein
VAGGDYDAAAGTITFRRASRPSRHADRARGLELGAQRDLQREPVEPGRRGTSPDSQGIATILNDETPAVSSATAALVEGARAGGLPRTRSRSASPRPRPSQVSYATEDFTAAAGSDYLAASGVLSFAPGQTALTVTASVVDDLRSSPTEIVPRRLSGPSQATLGDAWAPAPSATTTASPAR